MDIRKHNILDIATTLFLEKGFHNTSVQDIAVSCNVSKATIYKFFSSKEDIGLGVVLHIHGQLIYQMRKTAAKTNLSPREKLQEDIELLTGKFLNKTKFIDTLFYTFSPEQKEQYMPIIAKSRFNTFHYFSQNIAQTFGLENEAIVWELTLNLNGLIREITFLNFEKQITIDQSLISDFIIDSLEAIAKQRQGKALLITETYLQHLKEYFSTEVIDFKPICQRNRLLEALRNQVMQDSPRELQANLLDAITLLEQEYQKPLPKQFLIEALSVYLSQRDELANIIQDLQDLTAS